MSTNGKALEFFAKIPRLEADGSNWVIFKDRFMFAAAAASLASHVDGTGAEPTLATDFPKSGPLTDAQKAEYDIYASNLARWRSDEAIIRQAIASTISDSLFLEVRRNESAKGMWEAVRDQREKKSRMVTVDLRRKLQAEKCTESGDIRAHLYKLQAMREDLASMGGSITDEDFTSIILGSIPQSYDTYIAAITATSTLLQQTLTPTNLVDAIRDEADRRTIKSPKSKGTEQDAAYVAGQSSGKGKKDGDESKKSSKKNVKCYNCGKKGHFAKDCWAKGGGSEGKGPKGKGKGKEVAAKAEEKGGESDSDAVWMVSAGDEAVDSVSDKVTSWLRNTSEGSGDEYNLWTGEEIRDSDNFEVVDHSSVNSDTEPNESTCDFDANDFFSETSVDNGDVESIPGLISVSDSSEDSILGVDEGIDEKALDLDEEPKTSTFIAAVLSHSVSSVTETELFDSGASRHMSPYRHRFINYFPIQKRVLTAADGGTFDAIGKGDMHLTLPNGKTTTKILLKDVLFAPKMGLTLISIGKIDVAGFASLFHKGLLKVFSCGKKKTKLAEIPLKNGLYRLEHEMERATVVKEELVTIEKLHRLMGHISPEAAKALVQKGVVEGFKLDESSKISSCDSCEYGKTHRKAITKERQFPRASNIGDEIHSDVWGPSPVKTIGGREYYSTYTDDNSRFSKLYLQRAKDETFYSYKMYEAELLRQKGIHIKKLHSDRGGEYLSKEFSDHLAKSGTKRNLTVHDTPEHNGVAERLNRTLLEKVRAMLHASGLPKFLWGEAVKHAVYLKNRTSTKALDGKTPFEIFYGTKPNLSGLPEFGCEVWVHTTEGSKLDGRAVKGRWVGYDEESSGHRIYSPEKRTVSIQRSVKFKTDDINIYLPRIVPLEGEKEKVDCFSETRTDEAPSGGVDPLGDSFEQSEGRPKRIRTESAIIKRLRAGEGVASTKPSEHGQLPKGVQPGFITKVTDDDEAATMAAMVVGEVDEVEPSYEEARVRSDWPEWRKAIDIELESLKSAGTWDVVERPANVNVVDSKWVFRLKKDAKGRVIKWKARLVARGFTQVQGVDYFETFAPVARLASIRFILAVAARNDWEINMFDFHSAYLNGVLSDGETIYMEQPPYHEVADRSRYVVKLRKSLYGLKQAGRRWYDTLCVALGRIGFRRSLADPAVFFIHVGDDVAILFIHVDDTTITGSSTHLVEELEQEIGKSFDITHLGPVSWLLGLAITRDRAKRTLSISQEAYINSIVRRFNLEDAKPISAPIDANTRLMKTDCPESTEDKQNMKEIPYREVIGALNWVAVGSRPDVAFIVSQLAEFLVNPGRIHWEAAKRVIRYLKSTKELKLTYGADERRGFEGFTDADGATQDHRHAISGFAVLLDGGAVSWSSKKQELVTLSTMEAEYVGATHAAKELIWFRNLIGEIFRPLGYPTTLHSDNQSAIALANSDGQFHARSKHIDIRYHFIKFSIQDGSIVLIFRPTEDMIADILTKPLPLIKHKYFTHGLGLISV